MTYGEAFTVQPFGNSLVTMTLTAQDLKNVLEEQFAGCRGQSATATRIMLPSAGFKYTWDGGAACDSRIRNVDAHDRGGTETIVDEGALVVDPAQTYRVTVNNFMADGRRRLLHVPRAHEPARRRAGHRRARGLHGALQGAAPPYRPGLRAEDGGTPRIHRIGGKSCPTVGETNP